MNVTTKRHPRTLQEAFGPCTSNKIDEPVAKTAAHEWALYALVLGVAIAGLVGVL